MNINFFAVFLAGLSAFFLGYFWYTVVFNKIWMKQLGMKGKSGPVETPNLGRMLIISFILELIMALNLAMFIGPEADWMFGLFAGVAAGLGWVSLAFGVNYLFEGKSLTHWLINAGYNTVVFAVMGFIIGAM